MPIIIGFLSDKEMDSYLNLIGIQKESIRRMLIDAFGGDIYRCLLSFGSPVLDNTENEEKFKKVINKEVDLASSQIQPDIFSGLSDEAVVLLPKLYSELVKAPNNCLSYGDLKAKHGARIMKSIIKSNALYLLTGDYISKDRKKADNEDLVVPNCPLHLAAMKKYF